MRISEMVEGKGTLLGQNNKGVMKGSQGEDGKSILNENETNEDDFCETLNKDDDDSPIPIKDEEDIGADEGGIPDVLRNELNKIIYNGSDDDGKSSSSGSSSGSLNSSSSSGDEEEEEEEDYDDNESGYSGGGLSVIVEESESEEEWDSDATITEESAGHAPGETGISTDSGGEPGQPELPECSWSLAQSGTGSSGPTTPCRNNNSVSLLNTHHSSNVLNVSTPPIIKDPTTSQHELKVVQSINDSCSSFSTSLESQNNKSTITKSVTFTQDKENDKVVETNAQTKNTINNKTIRFKEELPKNVSVVVKSVRFADELVNSLWSSGVKGHVVPVVVNDSSTSSSSPTSEYFVLKYLAEEQQRQLDLIDLTKVTATDKELYSPLDFDSGKELSLFIEANTAGSYFQDNNTHQGEMHQRLSSSCSEHQHLPPAPFQGPKPRGVLRKSGVKKARGEGRNVTFNESLNLFYEAECQCWIHEEDYHRLRHEEHQQQLIYEQATSLHQLHHHHHHHHGHNHHGHYVYEPPPLEFEDTPTLSPPEGYKDRSIDRFFPHLHQEPPPLDPDVTRVSPPSPPSARRKVFLKENSTDGNPPPQHHHRPILNGLEEDEDDDRGGKKSSRFGGILKGGRLWRSNSSESKKVSSPTEEPDVVKCTEKDRERLIDGGDSSISSVTGTGVTMTSTGQQVQIQDQSQQVYVPTKVSTGTATLRTSEQIRLAVDSTLRLTRAKKNKQECSSLVEKLRWLTSLDDEDSSDSQSGFATWPSRDKNGMSSQASNSSSTSSRKSDAGTSTTEEFVHAPSMRPPMTGNEAKIKQISYTLEDIDEGLKGSENELETFITEDGGRMERIRRRYGGEDIGGDDYGFSRRPSVKGIKPKFSSTNQIFAQFTRAGAETPIPQMESQYENTRIYDPLPATCEVVGARVNLNYDQLPPAPSTNSSGMNNCNNNGNVPSVRPGPPGGNVGASDDTVRSTQFEMIRQSFEQASYVNYNRPHSWSVSTLPHNHSHKEAPPGVGIGHVPLPGMTSNLSGSSLNLPQQIGQGPPQGQPQQPQNNLSVNGALPNNSRPNSMPMMGPQQQQQLYGTLPHNSMVMQPGPPGQPIYGTVRRVPNVIGRPLFLHYGAMSVEAHPNKLVQTYPPVKVPETPSPTQQPPPIKYYGPPIRYYNPPPPVPPRAATTTIGSVPSGGPGDCQLERGNPEGATDEEPSIKEPYSMNV